MARAYSEYFRSTIGRKTLMGITGLGLCGFVLIHMLGNLLVFVSADKFNHYSYALTSNPLIYIAEIGLLAFFLGHTMIALVVTVRNRMAKAGNYAVKPPSARDATWAAKTLIYSGLVIFVFVVLHLITFKFGPHYPVNSNGVEKRDLYKLIVEVFSQPLYVAWYVFAMVLLALHLTHSISASMQTLGWFASNGKRLRQVSVAFGVTVSAGFILEALSVLLLGVH
ncbi:MAG: succinate dehydrogenase cytochrome b subunit [Bdellovibrionia bacterium]